MKRSSPLIVLVALTLTALSYGGKMAEDHQMGEKLTPGSVRAPASILPLEAKNGRLPAAGKSIHPSVTKTGQDSVVIAEFPPSAAPLEVEEIH